MVEATAPAWSDVSTLIVFGSEEPLHAVECYIRQQRRQDPSPMHEARRRTTQRNPRIPAYCETGRPYLRRTSGLGRMTQGSAKVAAGPEAARSSCPGAGVMSSLSAGSRTLSTWTASALVKL